MLWHDPAHPTLNLAAAPTARFHCPKGQAGRQLSQHTLGKPQVLGNKSKTQEREESRSISQARAGRLGLLDLASLFFVHLQSFLGDPPCSLSSVPRSVSATARLA